MSDRAIVTACVSTFRRPIGLATLLESLAVVDVPAGWRFRVVVADNDEHGSARETISALGDIGLDLEYAIEPHQGIPMARNCTTELALEHGADELIFIDDDEWVETTWLTELLSARTRHNSPIVMGAVIAEFEQTPPDWAIKLDAYQRRIWPDGHELDFAITANVILDASLLEGNTRPFEESLRYGGGEDLLFFQQLNRAGHRIVFAPDARAHELVPTTRVSKSWLTKRHYRRGLNRSAVLRILNFNARSTLKRLIGATIEISVGLWLVTAGAVRGSSTRLSGRIRIAYGIGLVIGLTGHQSEEYRTIHGR